MRTKNVNRAFLYTLFIYLVGASLVGFFAPAFIASETGSVLTAQVLILAATLVGMRTMHVARPARHMRMNKVSIPAVLCAMVSTAAIYPFLALVSSLMQLLVHSGTDSFTDVLLYGSLPENLLLYALLPACIEELMNRGLLYNGYLGTLGVRSAILLSAFLFGLFHMNLDQFAYTFLFGIFLCLVMEATDSLFACMACHFTLNAATVLTAYFSGRFQMAPAAGAAVICAALFLVISALFFRRMLTLSGREEIFRRKLLQNDGSARGKGGRTVTAELILSILICVLYMVVYEIVM